MTCCLAFGLAWVVGYGICRAVLRSAWRALPTTLRLGLGWTTGAAFAGMTTFAAIALAPGHRGLAVGLATALGLLPWLVRLGPDQEQSGAGLPVNRWQGASWWVGAVLFTAVLALWIAHGLDLGAGGAAGGWDAWSIWTHRARYFYLSPADWTRGFDPVLSWSHPEYPSLLPSLIVFGWLPAGHCVAASPILIALMTQVALLLLLVGFTQAAFPRTAWWPWAFGIFYATIPLEWSQQIAWQYADRPLAVFFLGGAGALALAVRENRRDWLFLAGLFWGAASFTKDEGKAGLIVLGIGSAFAVLSATWHGGGRKALGGLALLTLGLLPGLGSLALQRHFAPDTVNLIARMTLAPLSDSKRTDQILRFLADNLTKPERGGMWWGCGLTLVLLGYWTRKRELWLLWLVAMAQLSVYLLVFQITPENLTWHLDTAMPRLLFHVGPISYLAATWMILNAEGQGRGGSGDRSVQG